MSAATIARRTATRGLLSVAVFAVLFGLLFQYRILSLFKRMGADVAPIGTKLPIVLDLGHAPLWLQPFYYTLDYLNTVWFTTLLGLCIAGAAVAFLSGLLRTRLATEGPGQHLAAALLGIPNMFCTCCAATTLPGLRKAGVGLGPALAFFVTAPSLNLVVILLAFQMLPVKLALARTLLGLLAAIGVTYAVARLFPRANPDSLPASTEPPADESVAGLLRSWLRHTRDIAIAALPLLVAGIFAISLLKTLLPFEVVARQFGEGLIPTLVASFVGTLFMVPTFTEVLWVDEFTRQGMGMGPAAALLVTLPAVSFPSLWVLARVYGSYRLAAGLGVGILALGFVGGVVVAAI